MLTTFFNMESDLYYELFTSFIGKGDKESFAYALAATRSPYSVVHTPVGSVGQIGQVGRHRPCPWCPTVWPARCRPCSTACSPAHGAPGWSALVQLAECAQRLLHAPLHVTGQACIEVLAMATCGVTPRTPQVSAHPRQATWQPT